MSTVISMCFIFLLVFLLVPWQVAYLGCWLIHLITCASASYHDPARGPAQASVIPLIRVHDTDNNATEEAPVAITNYDSQRRPPHHETHAIDNQNHNLHLLLFMTWLLPIAAPVLAVWVRTLVTAGFTTPFDGDHAFFNVAPFLVLVDFASWNSGPLLEQQKSVIMF